MEVSPTDPDAKQTTGGNVGYTHNHTAMVVQLELCTNLKFLDFAAFVVLDHERTTGKTGGQRIARLSCCAQRQIHKSAPRWYLPCSRQDPMTTRVHRC